MAHFISCENQRATATRDAATGWVTVTVSDVGAPRAEIREADLLASAPLGPNPNLVTSALIQILEGGRKIRLAPALATAVGDAAAGQ